MKIAVVGDSFCQQRTEQWHWPCKLVEYLTGTNSSPYGTGYGGASWWSTRTSVLEVLKENPDVMVICHTEHNRIPSDTHKPLTPGIALGFTSLKQRDPKLTEAVRQYYIHLHSFEYSAWAGQQWFKELDTLLANVPKVIHLLGFRSLDYEFTTGMTVEQRLENYVTSMSGELSNHYTVQQNIALARIIADAVNTYSVGKRSLDFSTLE